MREMKGMSSNKGRGGDSPKGVREEGVEDGVDARIDVRQHLRRYLHYDLEGGHVVETE